MLDESKAAAPGVALSVNEENIETLPPGIYTVTAQKTGFRTTASEHITLAVNQKARLDLTLEVGEARDSVTAVVTASPVQNEEASIGYRLDAQTTEELPLDTRNVVALVTLGPGAKPRSVAFNSPIDGSRSTMNAFLLDGAYDTDSVQDFRIQTSLAPAEFPRGILGVGAQFGTISK